MRNHYSKGSFTFTTLQNEPICGLCASLVVGDSCAVSIGEAEHILCGSPCSCKSSLEQPPGFILSIDSPDDMTTNKTFVFTGNDITVDQETSGRPYARQVSLPMAVVTAPEVDIALRVTVYCPYYALASP